jgi:hypothetical protein
VKSLPGLGALVARSKTGTYTVTRTVPRTYNAQGKLNDPTESTLTIDAHVQSGGRADDRVTDGTHQVLESIVLFTTTLLHAGAPGQEADVVTISGKDYQVTSVRNWAQLAGFYKVTATEI